MRRRKVFEGLPLMAAVKCALAGIHGQTTWQTPRPARLPPTGPQRERLRVALRADGMTV